MLKIDIILSEIPRSSVFGPTLFVIFIKILDIIAVPNTSLQLRLKLFNDPAHTCVQEMLNSKLGR